MLGRLTDTGGYLVCLVVLDIREVIGHVVHIAHLACFVILSTCRIVNPDGRCISLTPPRVRRSGQLATFLMSRDI